MDSPEYKHHAAVLHNCTRHQSHPDSKEAILTEHQRVARELEPIERHESSAATLNISSEHQNTSLQRRQTSPQGLNASNVLPQYCDSSESYGITELNRTRSNSSSIREKHWYTPIVTFWTTHVRYSILTHSIEQTT